MANIPNTLRYAKSHEWIKDLGGGKVAIGLTDHAQSELGDLVFVNLPEAGEAVTAGERFGDVESVKAVSDVFSPVTGTVAEVNDALLDDPAGINADAYGAWMVKIEGVTAEELAALLSAEDYEAMLEEA